MQRKGADATTSSIGGWIVYRGVRSFLGADCPSLSKYSDATPKLQDRPSAQWQICCALFVRARRKLSSSEVIRGKTDANGVVVFWFRAMPPPRVWVIALDDYSCAEREEFATADVLQKGISGNYVDDARCKPYASLPPNPQPGEIVFPVHRLNLWQRIVRGLE